MHIRNHSRPLMVLFSLFIFCSQVFAEEYAELSACRLHFQTVVQPGATDIPAMDNWCLQTAKMNPLDVCADQKLYPFMATNSINNDEKIRRREIFRQECSREKNSQVAGSTQTLQNASTTTSSTTPAGAVIADKAGVTYAPATVAGAPRQPILNLQELKECYGVTNVNACEAANQSAIRANNLAGDAFRSAQSTYARDLAQQKNAENLTTEQRQQVQQATANAVLQAGVQALGAFGGGSEQSNSANTNAPTNRDVASQQTQNSSVNTATNNNVPPTPAETSAQMREAQQAAGDVAAANPQLAAPANNVVSSAVTDPNAAVYERTALSQDAETRAQQLSQARQEFETNMQILADQTKSLPFTNYLSNFNTELIPAVQKYAEDKEKCVDKAEKANKLCVEGRSPGAQAAKALMDYSAPVLALISSAHKACSSTAKIANLVGIGLTIAKGVCVAAKVTCDASCGTTAKDATQVSSHIERLQGASLVDQLAAEADCKIRGVLPPTPDAICTADVNRKKIAGQRAALLLKNHFAMEINESQAGTTGQMVASCHNKTKDILLMGTNILSILAAKASAQKCEKQLATNGGATSGDVTTTAEYCSVAANTSTQFCKCQGTPNAEGCGAVLAAGVPEASSSNQIGANLKTGSGLSNFAGGTGAGGSGSGSDFGIGSEGRAATGLAADLNGASSLGAGLGAAGGAGAGGGGAGGGAGGDPSAAAAGTKDEKKPGFGSLAGLANSLGGLFGGGRGGAAAGNGALSSQQQAAIQRKLASDKIAGEVTSSSGLDNFSKIKKSYGQKAETFMTAP